MSESDSRTFVVKVVQLMVRFVREVVTTIVPAVLVALFINVYVAEAAMVQEGPSMQPNLYIGYRVMTEKISYRFHAPQRGDVVVVDRAEEGIRLIKRVIGLPDETIEVRGGHVWIDGQPIAEPWVSYYGGPDCPATVIPEGYVFVIGDNRANSRDSRQIGPVAIETIEGHAMFIYWPLEAAGAIP